MRCTGGVGALGAVTTEQNITLPPHLGAARVPRRRAQSPIDPTPSGLATRAGERPRGRRLRAGRLRAMGGVRGAGSRVGII